MKLIIESVNVEDLMNEAAEVVSPLLNLKKGITFIKSIPRDTPDAFMADRTKVKQILVNLLSNSVKFTSTGTIKLKVKLDTDQSIVKAANSSFSLMNSWAKECKTFLKFSVKDTGIGVDVNDFEKIFSAFEQVRTTLMTCTT